MINILQFHIPYPSISTCSLLGKAGRSIGLVGLNDLAISELLVGIGRVDNLLLVVDNAKGGESVAWTELARPARLDRVDTTLDGAAVGLGGTLGFDNVLAGGGGAVHGVNLEVPGAGGVGLVTDAAEALDGPLRRGSHHGDAIGGANGRSSEGAGREGGGDESERELHGDGWGLVVGGWWFGV